MLLEYKVQHALNTSSIDERRFVLNSIRMSQEWVIIIIKTKRKETYPDAEPPPSFAPAVPRAAADRAAASAAGTAADNIAAAVTAEYAAPPPLAPLPNFG